MNLRRTIPIAAALLGASVTSASVAGAAPALRVQVDQHGDFLLIGNTIGYECNNPVLPVVGTIPVGACTQVGTGVITDSAPDLYWRADATTATADQTITNDAARSTAVLAVPAGATVTHAFLYWAGSVPTGGMPDTQVTLDRPGANGFTQTVNANQSFLVANNGYQSVADITALVQQAGSGAYRVAGISTTPFVNVADNNAFGGWALVVFYQRAADPLRNLAIFDGLDQVSNGNNQTANLTGFLVPNAGFDGKLGVIAYEGDNSINGDSLFFNGGAALTNALNPANNFFNGTRSTLGAAVSVAGDLPQLTGGAGSMAGIDLDVVDVTAKLTAGQTSAPVQATSTGDVYYLGAFITSVSTFKPDFTTSSKTATDVNGPPLLVGDTLQYSITVTNSGNDTSINTVLTDALPMGVTYVPGTITIGGVAKTDMAGDDQADYNAATRTVTARLGNGANGTMGGQIPVGGSVIVSFQVKIDPNAVGTIANQATISAAGLLGAPVTSTATDGNGPVAGSPPTTVVVDQCATNADCGVPTPVCDTSQSPKVCVACLMDSDCGGTMSGKVCDTTSKTCIDGCRGTGGNGCPTTATCTSVDSTIGKCVECLTDSMCGGPMSGKVCNGTTNLCVDGCRGMGGNGCPTGNECTSMDTTIGQCVQCLQDSDCGGPMSGKVCDTTTDTCIDGCKGTGGNGCPTGQSCTSMDGTIGICVECTMDSDCGGPGSGKVCDGTTSKCVDGCRGTVEGICPTGEVCTSMDSTIGQCVQCLQDSDCGGTMSGKVCDGATNTCEDGCRGTGGNGCPTGQSCTSMDNTIGMCVECTKDSDCGDAMSGKVCGDNGKCQDGCRGMGGNGCPTDKSCTSKDSTIGMCVTCTKDSDCGAASSGKVCDNTGMCIDGCRGLNGNGCPDGELCTSSDNSIGMCSGGNTGGGGSGTGGGSPSGFVASGNGLACAASPRSGENGSIWLLGSVVAALAALRRRRRD